jgi:hypothetical protein
MLKEVTATQQLPGEPRRRWFASEALDLYVWYDAADNVLQFQLCFDKGPGERALTWDRERGFSHHAVDDGENRVFQMKSTAILTGAAPADLRKVRRLFEQHGQKLEHDLFLFIGAQLKPGKEKG